MPNRPSGLVTFLFTDIEGSTRLWERDPAAMRTAVARHDELLAEAIARHGGYLFKHVGDAVQAAFADPVAAVSSVIDAQRALATAAWPETGALQVRMALHHGEATPNAFGDYNQVACLNRLARLLSAGHGGQVLLTDAVRRAVEPALPDGIRLVDLGRHRLRDLLEPEQVAQLTITGLPNRFPPLQSLDRFPGNLPQQTTTLIGREADLAAVGALLTDDQTRLLTLTGPGGVGKTRLALEVAADTLDQFEDGAWLVELGQIGESALVLPAIAEVLAVRESGTLGLEERLVAYLRERNLLLVLDNLEHLPGIGPAIARLLAACERLTVLATSRGPVRVRGERLYAVSPLSSVPVAQAAGLPAGPAAAPAVQLFVERARAVDPTFEFDDQTREAVVELCARLDGLPLAIELAAARARALAPVALVAQLDQRFDLLTDGPGELLSHQRALETTIAWSYDLLNETERRLFRAMATFTGGFTIDALTAVVGPDVAPASVPVGSARLVDASLVQPRPESGTEPRWALLESVRAFGLRAQSAAALTAATRRHAEWFGALAATGGRHRSGPEQEAWRRRLDVDLDNIRAALGFARETGAVDIGYQLGGTLWPYWRMRGLLTEGRRWLRELLPEDRTRLPLSGLPLLIGAGALASAQGDYREARAAFQTALALATQANDTAAETTIANQLGAVETAEGNYEAAERLFARVEALAVTTNDLIRQADALSSLGALAVYRGTTDQALRRYLQALALYRRLDHRTRIARVLFNILVLLAPDERQAARARAAGEECLAIYRDTGNPRGEGLALDGLGLLATLTGHPNEAATFHEQSLAIFRRLDDVPNVARALGNLGAAELDQGDLRRAQEALGEALRLGQAIGEPDTVAFQLEVIAALRAAEGNAIGGARLAGAAAALRETLGIPLPRELERRHQGTRERLLALLGDELTVHEAAGRALEKEAAIGEGLEPWSEPGQDADPLLTKLDDLLGFGLTPPAPA